MLPTDQDPDDYLRLLTEKGAMSLYGDLTPDIKGRIGHELKVIKNMGSTTDKSKRS